jgi:GntR family transcriptional regulator, transcriptional repressor for pyruvate dehydrogenase complex
MPNESLAIRVTDYIFGYIRDKGLSTGEAVPSEMRTSAELNISRGIVREAFRSLEVAGIIAKENGRSPRVGVLNSGFLTHLMVHAISTKQISVRQVLELRCSIEVLAAELAARKHTRSDIQGLRSAVDGMRQAVGKPAVFVQHDLDFHDLINRASGNSLIEVICEAMHESMQESMRVGILKRKDGAAIAKVVDSHEAIVNAIDQGNVGVAGTLMRKHFDEAQTALARVHPDSSAG